MSRGKVSRTTLYASGLRKLFLAQRATPAEARELRRRRMADGSYPLPVQPADARPLPHHFIDPRTAP